MTQDVDQKLKLLQGGPEPIKKQYKRRKPLTKDSVTPPKPIWKPSKPSIEFPQTPTEELEQNVVFKPNKGPQTDFLSAPETEVLYGGAAGGGKSFAMLADPIRYVSHPKFSALLLRRTTEELRDLVRESKSLYQAAFPDAKWSERAHTWTFPSGAQIWFSYLDRDDDVYRYQGQAFSWIGFDELTQWPTPFAWDYMRSRLRTVSTDLPTHLRASTNPGGPGHWWVKKMFIDPAKPGVAFWATSIETGEILTYPETHERFAGKPLFKRRFIPASLKDNPYLYESGEYELKLLSMPENQRRQLLYGDWDISEGAAFTEWNRRIHVIEPFDIPHNWPKFRAADYGYGSHTGVLWFAVDPKKDQIIVYRELYVSKVLAVDLAAMILSLEREDGRLGYGVLDSSLWHNRGDRGPSLAEQMISRGCKWRPSDRSKGSRVSGKNEVHRRLQVDSFTGEPGLVFFDTCTNAIAQLPIIPLDKRNPEDVDTNYPHDHLYDALRYGLMSRPRGDMWDAGDNDFEPTPADSTMGY